MKKLTRRRVQTYLSFSAKPGIPNTFACAGLLVGAGFAAVVVVAIVVGVSCGFACAGLLVVSMELYSPADL